MQPDAEHQENDPDLGELSGELGIDHEAGGIGTHSNAGDQIPNDRRNLETLGNEAERKCDHEGDRNSRNERRRVVIHVTSTPLKAPGRDSPELQNP